MKSFGKKQLLLIGVIVIAVVVVILLLCGNKDKEAAAPVSPVATVESVSASGAEQETEPSSPDGSPSPIAADSTAAPDTVEGGNSSSKSSGSGTATAKPITPTSAPKAEKRDPSKMEFAVGENELSDIDWS